MRKDTNQTAMQELIVYIQSNEIVYNKDLILKLKELLQKEKNQMFHSFYAGGGVKFNEDFENEFMKYYNENFNK